MLTCGVGVMKKHTPPTDKELREWESLRSLPHPGPETVRTVYRVAFPVLLDEVQRLRAENHKLRDGLRRHDEVEADLQSRVEEVGRLLREVERLNSWLRLFESGCFLPEHATMALNGASRPER